MKTDYLGHFYVYIRLNQPFKIKIITMKSTTILKTGLTLFTAAGIFFTACKKDNNAGSSSLSTDSTAANLSASSATSDNAYNDVFQVALNTGSDNSISRIIQQASAGSVKTDGVHGVTVNGNGSGSCAAYTVSPADSTTFPKTITVDFGAGCTSLDGVTRIGKITYVFSGRLRIPGTTVSATFTGYSVNGYGLQGTYSVTNNSTQNGLAYSTSVTNGKVIFPDSSWYTFSGHKSVVQTAGQSTPFDFSDDVYGVTGAKTVASSDNKTIYDSVTTTLVKANACHWVSQGVVSFTYNTVHGTFNFGTGTCDDLATINVGALSETIHLK